MHIQFKVNLLKKQIKKQLYTKFIPSKKALSFLRIIKKKAKLYHLALPFFNILVSLLVLGDRYNDF